MPRGSKPTPSALSQAVAGILRARKGKLDVTNAQIAEAANVSPSQVGEFLNANKQIDIEQLDQICYALGLNLTEVVREAERETSARKAAGSWPARPLPSGVVGG